MRMLTVLLSLLLFTVADVGAQQTPINPSINGYSPVSYFTQNKAEKGDPAFSVVHAGQLFYLTSAEQVTRFNADPERYRPRHRSCSYSLALGMALPLDPTSFRIVDGSLLLFHRSDEKDALLEWKSSQLTERQLIERADANLFMVKF